MGPVVASVRDTIVESPRFFADYYHQCTKYSPEALSQQGRALDWSQQPVPFKEYPLGTYYDLKEDRPDRQLWHALGTLLRWSYGLTAKLPTFGGGYLYLRAAPSAGGLYPAEIYLLSRHPQGLPEGVYHYQTQTHGLRSVRTGAIWESLRRACGDHGVLDRCDLVVVTTAIFERSAWRYEDRAYRRILLDTGHLLGNLELATALLGFHGTLIGGFADEALNSLLALEGPEEAAFCVIALTQEPYTNDRPALSSPPTDRPLPLGTLLHSFHEATTIPLRVLTEGATPHPATVPTNQGSADKYNFPFCQKITTQSEPIFWGPDQVDLPQVLLRRRSTRAYTGEGIALAALLQVLHFAYQPQDYGDQGLDPEPDFFDLRFMETFVAVTAVTGLEAGCYYYAPQAQELRQIRFKSCRSELHYLCLGQELGRDAAAVIFQTADLQRALAVYGDRAYRYLHMDAGHLGQKLNVAAIQLGLGVSGIGGFFDDQVNEVLGIPPAEAVLYLTTLGDPSAVGAVW